MCAIKCEEEIELENRIWTQKSLPLSCCVLKTTMLLRVVSDDEEEGTNKTT